MFDLAKFVALAFQIQQRVKQLNDNPPESLEKYTALAEEIEALIAKLKGQRQSPDFDTEAFKAARADALKGYLASDADLDRLPPITPPPPPPPPPPPSGLLDSDPGPQRFPANVWRSQTTPPKFLIHSGRVGDPIPSAFSPAIPGEDEPNWKILHQSTR